MLDQRRLTEFPSFTDFGRVTDPALYAGVPKDWFLGLTDVVRSTRAIEAGRYKAVNVAGSAAISAVMNRLGTRHFPFAFGGDGCVFALPAADRDGAAEALARTAAWVRDDIGLDLRTAIVTVASLREAGTDVRVAMFRPSPHVAYAMFDGGGVALAGAWLKAGRDAILPAEEGARPDLTGLSCRWQPIEPRNGAMVSIILVPGAGGGAAFRAAVQRILAVLGDADRFHPVDAGSLRPALLSPGIWLEALASRSGRTAIGQAARVAAHNAFGWLLFASRIRVGAFNPASYRGVAAENADYRKFGDALHMTADCGPDLELELMEALDAAEAAGDLLYGIHRQDAALMTCIVPSYTDDGHFHFVDGAGGGYAAAAGHLRRKSARAAPPAAA
ncbi:adenylate cyclase [Acuticoccus sediminis]|uniref:Adenylate cyclase n=1 Tax=Acuticoccus sediminis TaxID=2184697 RepID=A0A8B2NXQ1_9HYPH|nr:DUF3095 family protein [Acuticoccus sediminis]RAI03621.1 adenylate cyclase [Acuticoccus sediminis]